MADTAVRCRGMRAGEEQKVLALVMRVFDVFVRPDFVEEGAAEFERSARGFVLDHPAGHEITVAEAGSELVGVIDLRDGSHVCLFFVDPSHQRRGIGARLLEAALEQRASGNAPAQLTVNAAPSAVPAYVSLGFQATAPETELNGIRYVSMRKALAETG